MLPITHTPPDDPDFAMELPQAVKRRLRLDTERSWIVLSEVNRFAWPGPDLRPVASGDLESIVYGMLPRSLILQMRDRVLKILSSGRGSVVMRDA